MIGELIDTENNTGQILSVIQPFALVSSHPHLLCNIDITPLQSVIVDFGVLRHKIEILANILTVF